jgi:putative ABC transport system permease protein
VLIKHRVWQRAFSGLADPVGQRLLINDEPHTVVGVLPPSKDADDTFAATQVDTWVPFVPRDPTRPVDMAGEARLKPGGSLAAAEAELNRLAAAVPGQASGRADAAYVVLNKAKLVIADDAPLQTVLDNQLAQRRFIVQMLAVLSALALVMAIVGIYAVIAYNVAHRTSEIGIRMAFGGGRATCC